LKGKWTKSDVILLVLELTLSQFFFMSHMEQVIACEKCFLLSKESSFVVLLKTMYHEKKFSQKFCRNYPLATSLCKRCKMWKIEKLLSYRFGAGDKVRQL